MNEDDYLMLSGIQHMVFCERQWSLIHVEQLWQENERTIEGKHLHERADDPFLDESRGDIIYIRSMPIVSHSLKLRGVADVVEFHLADKSAQDDSMDSVQTAKGSGGKETCVLLGRKGSWRVVPVEYKRGVPKVDDRDIVQLCAQTVALEEMLDVVIREGFIFYGQKRRRQRVILNESLRERTAKVAEHMHEFFQLGITPPATKGKRCSQCSLVDLCVPRLGTRRRSVSSYLQRSLREVEET